MRPVCLDFTSFTAEPKPMADHQLPLLLRPVDLDEALKAGLPAKAIRELSPSDLYFALRETGADTKNEALALATTEQVQGIFDLDAWEGDRLNLVAVREWFAGLMGAVSESRLALHLKNLDPELVVALIMSELMVYPVGPDFEADVPSGEADWQSPDGRFWIWKRATSIGEQADLAVKALDVLYREDPDLAMRLLMQATTGLLAEMEETAHQFREARLTDLGFPPFDAAIGLWQPRTPKDPEPPAMEVDESAGRTLAVEVARRSRFRDKLAALPPETQAAVQGQLVAMANAALISEAVPVRNREALARTMSMVSGFLDLGLELPEGERYLSTNLWALFQLGLGRVTPLSRRAVRLMRSHVFDRWDRRFTLLSAGEAEFVRSLSRPHPLFGDPSAPEGRSVAFASGEQLAIAERTLSMLEAAAGFFFAENGMAETSREWENAEGVFPPREERTIHTLFGTLLARIVLKLPASVEPVRRADVAKLLANVEKLTGFRESLENLAATSTALGELIRQDAEPWLADLKAAAGKVELVSSVLYVEEGKK